jgi:signal transduction histidine kinase/CheY-like chemotaxis protein
VDQALASLGAHLGVDRCFAVRFTHDLRTVRRVHTWHAPDVPDPRGADGARRIERLAWLGGQMRAGQTVLLAQPDDLPAEAVGEQEVLEQLGLGALACAPLVCAGKVLGFVGAETLGWQRPWSDEDRALLRLVSEILAAALHRLRSESEQGRLEAQIRHTQKLESLGVLAGGIAHDFNNLLVGILGHAGLALGQLPAASEALASVQQIQVAAQRAAQLTNQLLAYSGKGRFVTARFSLNEVVLEMQQLLATAISNKSELVTQLDPELPEIEADPGQIRQVVMNLITNASDAIGRADGRITVRTGVVAATVDDLRESYLDEQLPPGRYVFVEVADTGVGMDEAIRSRIFDPFFTTKFTGRGLGLAVVLGIVRSHRGAIRVDSQVGRGTTFQVLLPAAATAAGAAPAAEPEAFESGSGLVLVVDDEESVRQVAGAILEQAGFQVLSAADGASALELLQRQPVRAMLLDLTMPHMRGDEVYARAITLRPELKVVLTSGYTEQEALGRLRAKGELGFIQKPYLPRELISIMARACREAGDPA